MLLTTDAAQALAQLDRFDAIIDARSESEYALDHLPGAVNWPSLNDAQRELIGTAYKQVSGFVAKKRGAALVARNIADHIERELSDTPKDWQPLVYCWRGGSRSGALAHVLDQIGFRVCRLEGGYQQYRRAIIGALEELPVRYDYRVICGTTGSGKSRVLGALRDLGAQVIDLEGLANHRGSVLGLLPGERQPGQKLFDSRVWDALRRLDPARPVFIESESKKVGELQVAPALIRRMRESPCVWLDLALERRVALLLDDYSHFVDDRESFCARLDALRVLRGHDVVFGWQQAVRADRVGGVVLELLTTHYDPIYLESMQRNFAGVANPVLTLEWDGSDTSLAATAARLRKAFDR